jgi:hypothetical protein
MTTGEQRIRRRNPARWDLGLTGLAGVVCLRIVFSRPAQVAR